MRTILVAEGDRGFGELAKAALAAYEVFLVSSREDCLARAREMPPALVVVGCLEPRGEAFALCRELRREPATREIPILVVDVSPRDHTRKGWTRSEGLQMETEGYVSRPLSEDELRDEVEAVLARSRYSLESWQEALDETERRLKREAESWRQMVGEMLRKAEAEALAADRSGKEKGRA